jgi:hypothetical protein
MVKFSDCKSMENIGAGFYTNSPFSEFSGCIAEGNFGPGFVDDSENGQFARLMRQLVEAGAPTILVDEIRASTEKIVRAVNANDRRTAFSWYERIVELSAAHVTVLGPLLASIENLIKGKWPF